ncbi:hypothetical protein C9426_27870 [Serratia sp. S1B]|nr:hypothetical protein C9426_27870 [Serratia sp. S1B]
MNGLMALGIGIIILGLMVTLIAYYLIFHKGVERKLTTRLMLFVPLILCTILGGFLVQWGDNQRHLAFSDSQENTKLSLQDQRDRIAEQRYPAGN